MKHILVLGAGGFIGGHLVKKLVSQGHYVVGVDIKKNEYEISTAHEFYYGDLTDQHFCGSIFQSIAKWDEVYQLAADMGGAGYIFTGANDANVMFNSAMINLNVAFFASKCGVKKLFYSSSACVYPEHNQTDANNPNCMEASAYPANPDSEYGWEKLFSERMYLAHARNLGLNVRIARFHNIFGPIGTYKGGKEKAPAAICRKIAEAKPGDTIEVWGDGEQTRSFLYIDECLAGIEKIMASEYDTPFNLGSEQMVTINQLVNLVSQVAGKHVKIKHIDGPLGVRGRVSHNEKIQHYLGWKPGENLYLGLQKTYDWVNNQVNNNDK